MSVLALIGEACKQKRGVEIGATSVRLKQYLPSQSVKDTGPHHLPALMASKEMKRSVV